MSVYKLDYNHFPEDLTLRLFMNSYEKMDIENLGNTLNERGVFLNDTKEDFLRKIMDKFDHCTCNGFSLKCYSGLSMDHYLGTFVIEAHFDERDNPLGLYDLFDHNDYFGVDRGEGFTVIRYGLITKGKAGIVHIYEPNDTISLVEAEKRIIQN